MLGGLGSGSRCAICEAIIAAGEIELEVRFRTGGSSQTLHLRCFSIFEDERRHPSGLQLSSGAREGA